ncbi:MAG: acetate kinase [Clostridia bacterium]|nr:acetate kinase [Clostridia bacterium]
MNVLVVNAGSSSLKYQLIDTATEHVLAKGNCERIGDHGSRILHKTQSGVSYTKETPLSNHADAIRLVVDVLLDAEVGCLHSVSEVEAIGHRVVHGGPYFTGSVLVTNEVVETLKECTAYAPLHTKAHLMGIEGCRTVMPDVPEVLVFDTAFHQTMEKEAYMYGLSYDVYEEYGVRRYGAHGTSHRYVSAECARLLGRTDARIVTCHIGNGSSVSAVKGGVCVDTSMGFTPLEGVLMGTRCGTIDPAIVPFLMEKRGYTPQEVDTYLNKSCGFLGISGVGSDSRDVERAMNEGNERAKLAFDMLCYQIRKYIGSYAAAMGGLDAVVFTAGIGEHTPYIRKQALKDLSFLGIELDDARNTFGHSNEAVKLSTDTSRVAVYMIPTNEELVIARDTAAIVASL